MRQNEDQNNGRDILNVQFRKYVMLHKARSSLVEGD